MASYLRQRQLKVHGVEFLEYLSPKNGRPYPKDEWPDDLIHWEMILITKDAETLYQKLKSEFNTFISASVISLPSNYENYAKGFYVRDPDGHVVGIFER